MKRLTRSRDGDEAKLCWGRLDTIENILGDDYDLEYLKELVQADREEMYIEDEVLVGVSSGSEFFTLQEKEWYETEKDAEIALERMRER